VQITADARDPIVAGLAQNITGPGANGRSTTAEELFDVGYGSGIPLAGKTGTAQGFASYPWNDSSVFAAFSLDSSRPYTVVAYMEKSGFGSRAAGSVVKCMFLALGGQIPLDPVGVSEPLDLEMTTAARPSRDVNTDCMQSSTANTVFPGANTGGRPVD
jgi:penicillin-binding protein 2